MIYEICNEPCNGATWGDVKFYASEVIPSIRSYDKDAVILIGAPNWSQDVDEAVKDPVTGYDNIMYTLHFYAATHKEDLQNKLKSAADAGLPIFVSEFGICSADGNGRGGHRLRKQLDQPARQLRHQLCVLESVQ